MLWINSWVKHGQIKPKLFTPVHIAWYIVGKKKHNLKLTFSLELKNENEMKVIVHKQGEERSSAVSFTANTLCDRKRSDS